MTPEIGALLMAVAGVAVGWVLCEGLRRLATKRGHETNHEYLLRLDKRIAALERRQENDEVVVFGDKESLRMKNHLAIWMLLEHLGLEFKLEPGRDARTVLRKKASK